MEGTTGGVGMRTAAAGVVCALTLSLPAGLAAQTATAGACALAVPASGQVVIVDQGPVSTRVGLGGAHSVQQYDLEVVLPVLGIPLQGRAAVQMVLSTGGVLLPSIHMTGQAAPAVLHGAAGDETVSVSVDQPLHGLAMYDPAEATIHLRGTGGTGMFEGAGITGDLLGFFRPAGTLYLGYPTAEAALAAVRRGLAQNASLSDDRRRDLLDQAARALTQATSAPFPPSAGPASPTRSGTPPERAAVTSAIQRCGAQAFVALTVAVPAGDPRQPVRVVVVGSGGDTKTVYQGIHAPGETVSVTAGGPVPYIVQVYVAGGLVKQITVPAG